MGRTQSQKQERGDEDDYKNNSRRDVRKNLHTDRGKEFYNLDVQKILKKHNINHYSTYSVMEASVIELNRTLLHTLKDDMETIYA